MLGTLDIQGADLYRSKTGIQLRIQEGEGGLHLSGVLISYKILIKASWDFTINVSYRSK